MRNAVKAHFGVLFLVSCGIQQEPAKLHAVADKANPKRIEIKAEINGVSNHCLTFKDGTHLTWQGACGQDDAFWSYGWGFGDTLSFFQSVRRPGLEAIDYNKYLVATNHERTDSSDYKVVGRYLNLSSIDPKNPDWNFFVMVDRESGGKGLVTTLKNDPKIRVCLGKTNYTYEGKEDLMNGKHMFTPVVDVKGNLPNLLPDTCAKISFGGEEGAREINAILGL